MNTVYNNLGLQVWSGDLVFETDTLKAMLLRTTGAYVPDPDHDTVAAILATGIEITAVSYARITLGSKVVSVDDPNNQTKITCGNLSFGTLESGQSVGAVLIYQEITDDSDNVPLLFYDGKTFIKSLTAVPASATAAITDITQANPGVVTSAGHGRSNGDRVFITGVAGMTEVNDLVFTVAGATTDTFQLSGVNTSGYTAYSSSGTWSLCMTVVCGFLQDNIPVETPLDFGGGATCVVAEPTSAGSPTIVVHTLAAAIDAGDTATEVQTTLNLPAALSGSTFTLNVPAAGLLRVKSAAELLA